MKVQLMTVKVLLFLFMAIYSLASSAMEDKQGQHQCEKIIKEGKKSKINDYETYIQCNYFGDTAHLTQSQFYIFRTQDSQKIGEILLQYYPNGGYYKTDRHQPTLRLRHIEVKDPYKRQHHATRALETLFTELRKSPHLPRDVQVWLEYSTCHSFLAEFYQKFGFKEADEPCFAETKALNVPLYSIKFPYYSQHHKK